MKVLTDIVARLLYAIPLLIIGISHFTYTEEMAQGAPFGGVFIIYFTGLALFAATISIVIKKKAALASLLLGVYLLLTAFTVHLPAIQTNEMEMGQVLKDIALAGAAFFMSGVFKKEEEAVAKSNENTE